MGREEPGRTVYTGRGTHGAEGGERERRAEVACATRLRERERERDGAFLFHRTVETRACHGVEVGGERRGGCAREGEKNEDEVNDIHAGYRILPSLERASERASSPSAATVLSRLSPPFFSRPLVRAFSPRLFRLSLSPFRVS